MNLNDKLKGFPTVHYFNLDSRTDRKDYMESQFDRWGIKHFKRISASKYLSSEDHNWGHLVLDEDIKCPPSVAANTITHLETIKSWLENTNEKYMLMMEDDYDLSLIEYWNFDWEYIMNSIPVNWDCILLGFEDMYTLPFFLHPNLHSHGFGPCCITRRYAEKLIDLHCHQNRFKLKLNIADVRYQSTSESLDGLMAGSGLTYAIPLITTNTDYGSDYCPEINDKPRDHMYICRDLYYEWWTKRYSNFSLEEFFSYGKPNDHLMTVNLKNNKYNYE